MDPRGLQAHAEELMAQFQRLRDGAAELQRKLQAVTATATSDDRYVTATVGPRGQLIRLELDPRIYRNPNSRQLAATITDTIQRAAADSAEKVAELCKPFLPEQEVRAHLNQDIEGMFRRMDSELLPGGELT
jgi:DNA-binding protein YbaB